MRVTQGLLFGQALDGVHRQNVAILTAQQQLSSGKRWTRPSEDATAAAESMVAHARQSTIERYQNAVGEAEDRLGSSAQAIQLLTGVLADAKEVAVSAGNSTLTSADRKSLAQRIDSVLAQVMEVANREDKYGALFGGTASGTPYAMDGDKVTYQGDDERQRANIGDTLVVTTNIAGSELFSKQARTASSFFGGSTGAAPGTGTDSGTDRGVLTVAHGTTTVGDGALAGGDSASGLKPAATSAALDTIIGPAGAHTITLDAVAKTIQLNSGAPVAYTGAETDFALGDGKGGTVHLNLTGIASGFNGTVNLTSTGTLSTDGGVTRTAILFSQNQVAVRSQDGSTTNINSTSIRYAGSETIDYTGTTDLFQSLIGLRNDLLNYDSQPAASRDKSLQSRARELSRNFDNANIALADVGSRLAIAQNDGERLNEMKDQVSIIISNLEDTDFASVVVDYNKSQLALQMAQAAGQRLMQTNFMSFLQ
ncbi:MAG: flagellar hook-associated protein FlgL [Planctomycetes bacterium]|nr:flagellar hook-associated protein FlgL [Planctomycetota bacterium]